MGVAKVKRWQWVVLSLVVGLAVAEFRRAVPAPMKSYGAHLYDQKTFESDIVREYRGRRLFTDLVVYPVEVDEGGRKALKHFVAGQYFDGRPLKVDGKWEATWRPYCFVAPVPFKALTDGAAVDPVERMNAGMAASARKAAATAPAGGAHASTAPIVPAPAATGTVLDFLGRMSREKGVRYTYAWWAHPHWQRQIWVGGSVVVIGVLWPTLVNLVAFGTLRRPAEAGPGLRESLREILRRSVSAPPAAPAAADTADVEQYDAAPEGRLTAAGGATVAHGIAAIGRDVPPAPRSLTTEPEPVAAAGPHDEHHYAAKADDFYPTEKKPVEPGHHRSG